MTKPTKPIAYLHTLWFCGPEDFPITGFILYHRFPYEGYNLENGDILDAAILQNFNAHLKTISINKQEMFTQFDLDYAVSSIATLANDKMRRSFDLKPKGNTKANYSELGFQGQTVSLTLYITYTVDGEETIYYTSFNPVFVDHDILDSLWDSVVFH